MTDVYQILNIICLWIVLYESSAKEIDDTCKVDCACCIDRKCGQGKWFCNECTLGCIDGHTGARCYEKCTHNCTKCDKDVEICTACYDGYFLGPAADCRSACLPGCKTCTSGTACTSCKEEYYNDNGHNDCSYRYCPEHCNCNNPGQCASCKDGYYNTSNSCKNLCPDNCVACKSNTECISCKDGYYNGFQHEINASYLLSDCTYKCRENCERCSSYNSCLVCKTGFYGSICEKICSIGCSAKSCDILTGTCDCFPNFVGDRCDRCTSGKYGALCNYQCPVGCKDNECEKDSGDCIRCYIDTITGAKCDVCSTVSISSEQREGTSGVVLGTLFAVSVVGNIIALAMLIPLKIRQRHDNTQKMRGKHYENSASTIENMVTLRNLEDVNGVQAATQDTFVKSCNYEDVESTQVFEHEYEQSRQSSGQNLEIH